MAMYRSSGFGCKDSGISGSCLIEVSWSCTGVASLSEVVTIGGGGGGGGVDCCGGLVVLVLRLR